jgi:hypothetical protein
MRAIIIIIGFNLLLFACIKKQPKIDYDKPSGADSITMDSIISDTTKTLVAELPVYFDSTDYIIHLIGFVNVEEWTGKSRLKIGSYSESDYSSSGFSVDSYREDYFSGNITNIVFENIRDGSQHLLAKKALYISYVQYLRELSKKIKRDYIMYSVVDNDNNQDGKLDYNDIRSLYLSNIDGTEFIKISPDFQQYLDGKLILNNLMYYFRTIEDTNKDGDFNSRDNMHYYFVDFTGNSAKVVEYNPFKLLKP